MFKQAPVGDQNCWFAGGHHELKTHAKLLLLQRLEMEAFLKAPRHGGMEAPLTCSTICQGSAMDNGSMVEFSMGRVLYPFSQQLPSAPYSVPFCVSNAALVSILC